jgi:hypothetical protein
LHLLRTKLEVKSMKRENSFPAVMCIRNDPEPKHFRSFRIRIQIQI